MITSPADCEHCELESYRIRKAIELLDKILPTEPPNDDQLALFIAVSVLRLEVIKRGCQIRRYHATRPQLKSHDHHRKRVSGSKKG
jgi:hypothetical protein